MTDTSKEAVKRLVRSAADRAMIYRCALADGEPSLPDEARQRANLVAAALHHEEVAATLRALLAERDALQAKVADMREAGRTLSDLWHAACNERDALKAHNETLQGDAVTQAIYFERALKDRDRMRGGLQLAAGIANELSWNAKTRSLSLRLADIIRAALKGTDDE